MTKKASILVLVYIVIMALLLLSTALMSSSISEKNLSGRFSYSTRAFWAAEGGTQRALWELRYNNTTSSASHIFLGNVGTSAGDYNVSYSPTTRIITSRGYYPSSTASNKITRTISLTVSGAGYPYFAYAAFGKNFVYLNNNAGTDSYNASLGTYAATKCSGSSCHGDVGSDGTGTNPYAATVNNNANVKGNLSVAGNSSCTSITNNAVVTGNKTYNTTVSLPGYSVPSSLTGLSSSGSISLTNNAVSNLSAGHDYKYSSISLDNNAILNITGTGNTNIYITNTSSITVGNNAQLKISSGAKVTIYTDGKFDFNNNGGVNNLAQVPSNFTLYCNYTGDITIANNVALYGGIYAPNANLTVNNNADTYGSVIGKSVTISNNGKIHYDESLKSLTNTSSGSVTASDWREI